VNYIQASNLLFYQLLRYIKLIIPVKTYVKKYIEVKYPGNIKLNLVSTLGRLIYCCLEKQSSPWYKKRMNFSQRRYKLLTDEITVLLPANQDTFYKTGFSIPAAKSILVNNFFEDQIIDEIIFLCKTYSKIGFSNNLAIEDFCDEYNIIIDDDITHAAFKKAVYRYRKNLEKAMEKNKNVAFEKI
jgi:hypothetical protein